MGIRRHHPQVRVVCLVLAAWLAGCAGISEMSDTPDSLMREGTELYAAKRYHEAITKFERVLEMGSSRWLAYVDIARCSVAKLGWLPAITNARMAYRLAPAGEDVVPVLAEALFGGGVAAPPPGPVLRCHRPLRGVHPPHADRSQGHLNVGRAYLGTGNHGDALSAVLRGLGQAGDGGVRQELIQGLLDGGMQALGAFGRVLELSPGHSEAL